MKRVLLLNERCHANPRAGGAEVHLLQVFSRLTERGEMSVELLCSGTPGAADEEDHRGLHVTRLGTSLAGYYGRVAGAVRRRVRAGRVDLVVEAHNKVPFLSPLYAGAAVMVIHHHLHGATAFRQVSWPVAAGVVSLEASIPRVYGKVPIVTISESSKDDLISRGLPPGNITIVPCGVDHDRLAPGTDEREPIVVSLGRLEPYKRIDLLLRAFKMISEAMPAARLVIVGQGPDEVRLWTLCTKLGLDQAVEFTGFVDEPTKVRLLQRAAVLVQCSSKEGWGLTVTEAAACGTPAVASDVPGLRESVKDGVTGLLVSEATPVAFAEATLRLLKDGGLRSTLGSHARQHSLDYSWEAAADGVLAVAASAATNIPSTELVSSASPTDAGVLR